jgi:peptidoglycan/xylan/chitin deacetylase (PgdA/CDA1 family)
VRKLALPERLRRRLRGSAIGVVLCYHRISQDRPDPWELCVSPDHFAEHLEVVSAVGCPVPLVQLDEQARAPRPHQGHVRDRPLVAVTFDDGYADNLHRAKPLLEAADIPATVFVVSGAIGQAREFWWDELDRALLSPAPLPPTLEVRVDGETRSWRLDNAPYTEADDERYADWTVGRGIDPLPRHSVLRSAHGTLRLAPPSERDAAMTRLLEAGASRPREDRRALSEEELLLLADGGLVEIGAHTVTHPVLSSLSEPDQRWEVARPRTELEALIDRPVRAFAYPYGGRGDYTPATVDAVREAGYAIACTTSRGLVYRRSSPFELPRYCIGDWDGEQLARALDEWLRE